MTDLIERIVRAVLARGRLAIALSCLLVLVCLPLAIRLYANLKSAIEELLPRSAPSVKALEVLHSRLGEHLQLSLLVSGAPSAQLHRFADRLADEASRLPQHAPRIIDYKPERTERFFMDRRLLFPSVDDLRELSSRVDERIEWEERHANPFDLGLDLPDKPPDFEDLLDRYRKSNDLQVKTFPSGYYDGADGRSLVMIFVPSDGASGYDTALAFHRAIADLAHRVAGEMGLPGLRFEYGGDVTSMIEEQRSLIADLLTSSLIVLVAEAALLLAFFRWKSCLPVLGLPLAMGTVVTFAIAFFVIGSVNASTAFLGSIIVGNGVNSGIILLARFIEERRNCVAGPQAMQTAVRATALATLIASSAAALSYGALMVSSFRGYTQFGFMGGIGMVLCWAATYLLVPPLALAFDARYPVRPGGWLGVEIAFGALGKASVLHVRRVALVGMVVTAFAVAAIIPVARDPFEHNVNNMRSRVALEPGGSQSVDAKVDKIVGRFLTPVAVLLDSAQQAEPLAAEYRTLIAGGDTVLGSVLTLQSLVPRDQPEKIAILQHLRGQLTGKRMEHLDAKTASLVRDWLPPEDLKPFSIRDLPEDVLRTFRENNGMLGRMVLLFPKVGTNTSDGRVLARLAHEVRSVSLPPGAAAAGSMLLFADVFHAIARDGPVATGCALLAVLLLSILLARGGRGGAAVPLSLITGVIWMLGAAALMGTRINFLNFAALPITFGIGVDYATNIYRRYWLGAANAPSLIRALGASGAAVAICSGTTIIGYSSLLFSRNGALFSFGLLSVLGEIGCLSAALLLLPAMLSWKIPHMLTEPMAAREPSSERT